MNARFILGGLVLLTASWAIPAHATPRQDFARALGVKTDVGSYWSVQAPAKLGSRHMASKRGDRLRIFPMVRVTDMASGKAVMIDVNVEEFWSADRSIFGHKLGIDVDVEEFWSVRIPARLRTLHLAVKVGSRVKVEPFLLIANVNSGKSVMFKANLSGKWRHPKKK